MSTKTVEELIEDVIDREGGYVSHPADRGGETNWGITKAVARQNGFTGQICNLPRVTAAEIYRQIYWITPNLHKVAEKAESLAEELFDTGINMGTGTAAGFLQRALNALNRNQQDFADLTIDRRIGPATLNALGAFLRTRRPDGEQVLIKAI
jgi:lysozyme family protein